MRKTKLLEEIDKVVKDALRNARNTVWAKTNDCPVRIETRVLNASYLMGRYHTLLDELKSIDMDEFIHVVDKYDENIEEIMRFEEQIYSWR